MHIPDGFVSGPLNAGTFVVSALACGVAMRRVSRQLGERQIPVLGVTAAFVFAAQLVNFPVAGGTSGHFLGAALAAILAGPSAAILIMSVVLTIQCLVFADGGLSALGTNVFNMAIAAPLTSYVVARVFRRWPWAAAALAGWLSIVVSASLCAWELALSELSPLRLVLPAMAGVHAVIGAGEAVVTVGILGVLSRARPDLFKKEVVR